MKSSQINIRDPFVLYEDGRYYLYGSRARNFAIGVGGFDVYVSEDLENWSEPIECFNSAKFNMNREANWAPEVHAYNGEYYMFATFTRENGLRGTFSLKSNSPLGPFVPHSKKALTPEEWECLDGTLYISGEGKPYLVFCHEHTQIIDGTICFIELNKDLSESVGNATTLFCGSSPKWADKRESMDQHYVTDGPYLHRSKTNRLFMIWSTFLDSEYSVCIVRFLDNELGVRFEHLAPLKTDDGGHGMIFHDDKNLYLTYHSPNEGLKERPVFRILEDDGDSLRLLVY